MNTLTDNGHESMTFIDIFTKAWKNSTIVMAELPQIFTGILFFHYDAHKLFQSSYDQCLIYNKIQHLLFCIQTF